MLRIASRWACRRRSWIAGRCILPLALVCCARSGLDDSLAVGTAGTTLAGGVAATGGSSRRLSTSSDAGGVAATGGSSRRVSATGTALVGGGTTSSSLDVGVAATTGGAPTCPESVPTAGADCSRYLICAYETLDKGCCKETASARCKDGHWSVAASDCDCLSSGGTGSFGGSAAGGSSTSGGKASSGGASATGGATGPLPPNGCRGEPIGYIAPTCDLLVSTLPPLMKLADVTGISATPLGLARATDDSHCVSVVTTKSGSASESPQLLGLSFEPWSNWPKTGILGPLREVPLPDKPAGVFTLGPSGDRQIALAWQTQANNVMFGSDLDVDTFRGTYRSLKDMHEPSAIGKSGIGHLVAALGGSYQATQIWGDAGPVSPQFYGGCADTEVNMGVEPYGQGFLWAATTGSNNPDAVCSYATTSAPGAATRIAIGQIAETCCSHTLWDFEMGDTVTALKTAPHPEGLWVVWQTSAPGTRQIYWMRIGFDPTTVLGPGAANGPDDVPTDFAVAALGNRLAVAWGNDLAQPRLSLSLIDEKGKVTRNDPAVRVPELHNLSMVSGPAGAGLLIGFADGNLMRLDCSQWE